MLAEAAREEGYRTVEAGDGKEALAALAVEWPSLILLDLEMPVMSGWAFMRELRARAVHIPVIIMSGRTDQASKLAEMGAKVLWGSPLICLSSWIRSPSTSGITSPPFDYGTA